MVAAGSKPDETSTVPPCTSGGQIEVTSPMTWNIGDSARNTESAFTWPSTPKLTPVKNMVCGVRITPFGTPDVPEV